MKRMLSILCLLALLLSGCGAGQNVPSEEKPKERPEPAEQEETAVQEEVPAPEGLTVEMERAVYDPSVERYTYFIRNNTDRSTGMFGEPYWVQKLENGQWRDLEAENGVAFTAIGYGLEPGGAMALTCWMGAFSEERTPGKYRLVKSIEDEIGRETYTLYAEFEIGESIYTADTPYGFIPLEELTVPYAAPVSSATAVVFTHDGMEQGEMVEEFLFKSGLGADCQLRTVQDYGEGTPMVIDVIYENDHFLWRMWSDGYVTEKRFSYIVTDGIDLYLSDGADWDSTLAYDSDKTRLIPERAETLLSAAEEQTEARLEGNITRYKIWSQDGAWCAGLPEYDPKNTSWGSPMEFFVSFQKKGVGSRGSTYDLRNWDRPETAITALEWQEDGKLRLTCETEEGNTSVLVFDTVTETLTTFSTDTKK